MYDPYCFYCQRYKLDIQYVITTPAAALPVSLAQLKQQARLRPLDTSEDDYLTRLITTATDEAERYTRRDIINKTWTAYLDRFPWCATHGIQLRRSKLQSITSIKYLDLDGVLTTVDPSIYYTTISPDFSSVYLAPNQNWPSNVQKRHQAVQIAFVSGYGAAGTDVPTSIQDGILQHCTAMYQARGDAGDGGYEAPMPATSKLLYDAYKILIA